MADKKQRLVLSILDFLSDSMDDGTVKEEDKEGVEVAGLWPGFLFYPYLTHAPFYAQHNPSLRLLVSILQIHNRESDLVSNQRIL
jgi:hypothetical protein